MRSCPPPIPGYLCLPLQAVKHRLTCRQRGPLSHIPCARRQRRARSRARSRRFAGVNRILGIIRSPFCGTMKFRCDFQRYTSPDIRNSCVWPCKPCRFYRIRAVNVRSLESPLTCWRAPCPRNRGVLQPPSWLHGRKSIHWGRDRQHRADWSYDELKLCIWAIVLHSVGPKHSQSRI